MKVTWHLYRGIYAPTNTAPLMQDLPLDLQHDLAMEDHCWIVAQVYNDIDLDYMYDHTRSSAGRIYLVIFIFLYTFFSIRKQ